MIAEIKLRIDSPHALALDHEYMMGTYARQAVVFDRGDDPVYKMPEGFGGAL